MRCYHGLQLAKDGASFQDFREAVAGLLRGAFDAPIVLVRNDGVRLILVVNKDLMMLSFIESKGDYSTSVGSAYLEGTCQFNSFDGPKAANWNQFVDPGLAIEAVQAFFNKRLVSDFVDFTSGVPDADFLRFPEPVGREERELPICIKKTVDVPEELRSDMAEVCQFLDETAEDPDVVIDFDDAIQIGTLCGGRINERADRFFFSYHLPTGDTWDFYALRTELDCIADGSQRSLKVTAYEYPR